MFFFLETQKNFMFFRTNNSLIKIKKFFVQFAMSLFISKVHRSVIVFRFLVSVFSGRHRAKVCSKQQIANMWLELRSKVTPKYFRRKSLSFISTLKQIKLTPKHYLKIDTNSWIIKMWQTINWIQKYSISNIVIKHDELKTVDHKDNVKIQGL